MAKPVYEMKRISKWYKDKMRRIAEGKGKEHKTITAQMNEDKETYIKELKQQQTLIG